MKIKQILAILIISHLQILLSNYSAKAFNLIYKKPPITDAFYDPGNGKVGYLYLNDLKKLENPRQNSNFWRTLTSSFSDWEFISSSNPVYGDFVVSDYTVCPPGSYCASPFGSVGSRLSLEYVINRNAPNQPEPDRGNLRWIQLVRNNHSLEHGYGIGENVIDIDVERPNQRSPYYDAKRSIGNSLSFNDEPKRSNIDKNHDWKAWLFLAEDAPGQKQAKIYGGVSWGWHNRIIDKQPDTPPAKPRTRERERQRRRKKPQPRYCPVSSNGCDNNDPPSNGGSGGGGFNKYDPNYRYTTIPESTPVIGVITLGAWAIVKTLKLRKKK